MIRNGEEIMHFRLTNTSHMRMHHMFKFIISRKVIRVDVLHPVAVTGLATSL